MKINFPFKTTFKYEFKGDNIFREDGKKMTIHKDKSSGYTFLRINDAKGRRKYISIAELKLRTFVGKPHGNSVVRRLKQNSDKLEHLEWSDRKNYFGKTRISPSQKERIVSEYKKNPNRGIKTKLAKKFKRSIVTIARIIKSDDNEHKK